MLSRTYVQVSEDSTRLLHQHKSRRRHNPYKGEGKIVRSKSRSLYKYEPLETATTIRILVSAPRLATTSLRAIYFLGSTLTSPNGLIKILYSEAHAENALGPGEIEFSLSTPS